MCKMIRLKKKLSSKGEIKKQKKGNVHIGKEGAIDLDRISHYSYVPPVDVESNLLYEEEAERVNMACGALNQEEGVQYRICFAHGVRANVEEVYDLNGKLRSRQLVCTINCMMMDTLSFSWNVKFIQVTGKTTHNSKMMSLSDCQINRQNRLWWAKVIYIIGSDFLITIISTI